MNVEIGAEAAQFPEKEYMSGITVAVWWNIFILLFLTLSGNRHFLISAKNTKIEYFHYNSRWQWVTVYSHEKCRGSKSSCVRLQVAVDCTHGETNPGLLIWSTQQNTGLLCIQPTVYITSFPSFNHTSVCFRLLSRQYYYTVHTTINIWSPRSLYVFARGLVISHCSLVFTAL